MGWGKWEIAESPHAGRTRQGLQGLQGLSLGSSRRLPVSISTTVRPYLVQSLLYEVPTYSSTSAGGMNGGERGGVEQRQLKEPRLGLALEL